MNMFDVEYTICLYHNYNYKNLKKYINFMKSWEKFNILILTKFLFRKDIRTRFYVMSLQEIQIKKPTCLEILDIQGYIKL